jgi:hypothetical protein
MSVVYRTLALLLALMAPAAAQVPGQQPPLGFGSLAVTGSSTTISSILTTGPNSAAWPPPGGGLTWVLNPPSSGGTIYVCPVGSIACTTNGVPVPAGTAYGFRNISSNATVIGSTSLTAAVQW